MNKQSPMIFLRPPPNPLTVYYRRTHSPEPVLRRRVSLKRNIQERSLSPARQTALCFLCLLLMAVAFKTKFIFTKEPISLNGVTTLTRHNFDNWNKFGLSPQHFTPTFMERVKSDPLYIRCQTSAGIIRAKDGVCYYISYPALGYLLIYSALKISHLGYSERAVRIFNTAIFFMVLGFIMGSIWLFSGSAHAVIAAGLAYVFPVVMIRDQTAILWSQSITHLFVAIQLFIIAGLLNHRFGKNWAVPILVTLTFLGSMTDWVGGLYSLGVMAFFLRIKKPRWALITLALLGLAMGLMLHQYSSIDGFFAYFEAIKNKFLERSSSGSGFETQILILKNFAYSFWPIVPIFILGGLNFKGPLTAIEKLHFGIAFIPALFHFLILPQYNAIHAFEMMKMSLPLSVLAGFIYLHPSKVSP